MSDTGIYKRILERERTARKEAEKIMEQKSSELYESNLKLRKLNEELEQIILERTREIEDREAQYRQLIESANDIIYRCDPYGNFTFVNAAAVRLSGYTKTELIGKSFMELVLPSHVEEVIAFYKIQFENRTASTYLEFPIRTKRGNELWLGQNVQLSLEGDYIKGFTALGRDITDRKKAETLLLRSEEKYRGILENLDLGLLEVDTNGLIIKAYPRFCEMTGYSASELIGKDPHEFLLPKEQRRLMREQESKRKTGESGVYEIQVRQKNGSLKWMIVSGAPFYNERNEFSGSLGVHLDISKRKKMEEELQEAKELAERSVRIKEQFLANMSHEIRTPMNAIIGMGELLAQSRLTKAQSEYLSAIRTSASSLLAIINDILDFSKMEAGKLDLEYIPFNLRKLIKQVYQTLNVKAEEKGIRLGYSFDNAIHEELVGDPTRLLQVLINLVNNAIKFTTEGEVSLKLKLLSDSGNTNIICFEIKDTGVGIAEDKLETIFESFSQESHDTTRKFGGTGLGLSISKQIVSLYNSELKVKSKKGKGSCFYFTLSLEKGKVQEKEEKVNFRQHDLTGTDLLLVEDHEINRFMATTILKKWGVKVDFALNGREAIEKVKQNAYQIILMDMQMPVMGGIEATKIIRNELKKQTPIIALTANAIKGDKERCLAAGMDDYVSKPFDTKELFNKISLLVMQENNKVSTKKLYDLSGLNDIVAGDLDFKAKMLEIFVEQTPEELLKIEEALQNQDYEAMRQVLHKLKPSVNYTSPPELYKKLVKLEKSKQWDEEILFEVNKFVQKIKQIVSEVKHDFAI